MVEIENKYKIYEKKFGFVNWIGFWTLYKKEVLRFLVVVIQTVISPLVTSLLFLLVLSLAIGNDKGEVLGVSFIIFLACCMTCYASHTTGFFSFFFLNYDRKNSRKYCGYFICSFDSRRNYSSYKFSCVYQKYYYRFGFYYCI